MDSEDSGDREGGGDGERGLMKEREHMKEEGVRALWEQRKPQRRTAGRVKDAEAATVEEISGHDG